MVGPPPTPQDPPMGDEATDVWDRLAALDGIAERMAATCSDPIAVSDYWLWKAAG